MKIISQDDFINKNIPQIRSSIACIGNFDGVHLGHKELLERCVSEAKKKNLSSIVITFDPHPSTLFSKNPVANIHSLEEKQELLASYGLDYCFIIPFTTEFALKSARDFAIEFLENTVQCKELIIGHNFSMGSDKCHTSEIQHVLAKGTKLTIIEEVLLNSDIYSNIPISSSNIRKALNMGDIELVNAMLGRVYSQKAKVVHGAKRGSTLLGFPTANLDTKDKLLPKQNVYATSTKYPIENGKMYKSISNIGYNPTFNNDTLIMESYILDFEKDIYDEEIEVFFHKNIREEQKFNSIEELIEQLQKDKAYRLSLD